MVIASVTDQNEFDRISVIDRKVTDKFLFRAQWNANRFNLIETESVFDLFDCGNRVWVGKSIIDVVYQLESYFCT